MKRVFRLFLLFSFVLAGICPESGSASAGTAQHFSVSSLAIRKAFYASPGIDRHQSCSRIRHRRSHIAPGRAVFEAEPESHENPDSNFAQKQARVTGFHAAHFGSARDISLANAHLCPPVRGHFPAGSRRHIVLRVIRV